jgi:Fe2+ or Zn2+ uptake regulation protein
MDAQDLKSAGLKVTLPRLKILEIGQSEKRIACGGHVY